ncbi:MAG: TonB-dependent receptor [Bacteroidia bacterium]
MMRIWLFTWAAFVWAQKVTLQGRVLDESTKEALPGAKVLLEDGATGTLTNLDGEYQLEIDYRPKIKVTISYEGYEDKTLTLELLPERSTVRVDFLIKGKVTQLEEVVVSAAKFEQKIEQVTVSMDFIKPRSVENLAAVDPIKVLEQTPGINVNKDQPSIRGSSGYTYGAGSRVLLLLDGLPMMSADRLSTQFELIPVDVVGQIEVVKGASSVVYGTGALGGIINAISLPVRFSPYTVLRVQHQIYDSPRSPVGDWDGRKSASLTAVHLLHSQRIETWEVTALLDLIRNTGYLKNGTSQRVRPYLRILQNAPFLEGLQYGVSLQANIDSGATWIAWDSFPTRALIPGDGFITYQVLQRYMIDPYVSYLTPKGNRHTYRGRVYTMINDLSTPQSGYSTLHFHEYQYVWGIGKWGKLISGLNYTQNNVYAREAFGKARGRQLGVFSQAEIDIWKFHISLGARYQYEDVRGDTSFKVDENNRVVKGDQEKNVFSVTIREPIFRGGVTFTPWQGTIFRFSFGQGIRSPSVAERFTTTGAGSITVVPNPQVKIERGYSAELGIRQYLKVGETFKGFVDVAAFRMEFKDLVEFVVNSKALLSNLYPGLPFSAVNISRAYIQGVEPIIGLRWEKGKWYSNLSGGLTLIDPVNRDGLKELDSLNNAQGGYEVLNAILLNPTDPKSREYKLANDQSYTLPFRNRLLIRGVWEIGWSGLSLTTNYRYASSITNVNKIFFLLGAFANNQLAGLDAFFRGYASKSYHVFDFILSWETSRVRYSFHIFNAFNTIYSTIPGILAEQRNFAVQVRWLVQKGS